MTQVSRAEVEAFYRAYVSRDPDRIAAAVDENAEWLITGPVAVLPFCGLHRGRAEIAELFGVKIPSVFEFRGFNPEDMVIDCDRVAVLGRFSGVQRSTGRLISYRCAQFVRFTAGKAVSVRVLLDSFDAAEQMVGRPLDLGAQPERPRDLVAL